jgi:hypothetical protein
LLTRQGRRRVQGPLTTQRGRCRAGFTTGGSSQPMNGTPPRPERTP